METTDEFETHMRDVLHEEDDQAAGFTAAQVIAKGRHRRRTRTAAVSGVALVAAGAVAVVPSALIGGSGHGRGGVLTAGSGLPAPVATTTGSLPAPSSPMSVPSSGTSTGQTAPSSPPSSTPSAHVVPPGTITLVGGYTITLTKDSVTFAGDGGAVGPLYTDNGNQGTDSIGLQSCGRLVGGVYIGSGEVASGQVTVDGKVHAANIVTLAGHPGWSVAYVDLAALPQSTSTMSISVFDAAEHQLATFAVPPRAH
ncbi:hypothetical protein KGQ19_06360 [Catenulispora sp. NL8]|uniref:Uncharacterized protein n=1 Tax=Catenulispora pinistramenti TaxID=2705254 RepID=A0ABS5KKJ4_9ACTN|nr:hypothetical protein [Catenulispora pinistramenti]MBS2546484.1 hypothetical protein [Catenulispora pinistramenti]